jgi:hypothetical protein
MLDFRDANLELLGPAHAQRFLARFHTFKVHATEDPQLIRLTLASLLNLARHFSMACPALSHLQTGPSGKLAIGVISSPGGATTTGQAACQKACSL